MERGRHSKVMLPIYIPVIFQEKKVIQARIWIQNSKLVLKVLTASEPF